jgi:hypothetical protein
MVIVGVAAAVAGTVRLIRPTARAADLMREVGKIVPFDGWAHVVSAGEAQYPSALCERCDESVSMW